MSKYKTVSAESREKLDEKVRPYINDGYKPVGGVDREDGRYYQSLFKEDGAQTKLETSTGRKNYYWIE